MLGGGGWDCDRLFCLGWVVCINRAEFSGVVWSVLVGLLGLVA